MRRLLVVAAILAACFPRVLLAQSTAPLVQPGQVVWEGAFRLPHDNGDGLSSFSFGGYAMAYDAARNGLYIACHVEGDRVGEVSIPTPSKSTTLTSLPIATRLQACADVTEGRYTQIGGYPKWYYGGLLLTGPRLLASMWSYFDSLDPTAATASHFTHSPTTTATGTVTGPHVFAGFTQPGMSGFVGGYMASVPTEWQGPLGGQALTGQCCIPIAVRSSWGPNAIAFNPSDLGAVSPVPDKVLLNYPQGTGPVTNWLAQSDFYNLSTFMAGMFIPSGTRSLLYIGRQGIGPGSYRSGVDPYCGDGLNAPPYQIQVWAYDLNDLAAVKAGTKTPNSLRTYARWALTSDTNPTIPHVNQCMYVRGLAFDPATQRIWVKTGFPTSTQRVDGDYEVVQQFRVSIGTPPPPPPPPPTCLYGVSPTALTAGASGGQGTVQVTTNDPTCAWTAAGTSALTISPLSGTGSGSVTLTIAANTATTPRTLTATIAGTAVTVTQDAAPAPPPPPPSTAYSVSWSTLFGGSTDDGEQGIFADAQGNTYVVGGYSSLGGTFPATIGGPCQNEDVIVGKFSPTGVLVWSRCMGGPARDYAHSAVIDAAGNVFVVGVTYGAGFPVTTGAFQTTLRGTKDNFVVKLNANGGLVWSTLLGGSGAEHDRASITLDQSGNVVVAGATPSTDFPTTVGAYRRTNAGGHDGYVTKLSPDGRTLVASTLFGGAADDHLLAGVGVTVDGNVVAAGFTRSGGLSTTGVAYSGGEDALIVKFDSTLSTLRWATYIGGSADDRASENHGMVLDGAGRAIIGGYSGSPNLPVSANAYQKTNKGGFADQFAAIVSPSGALVALTYLGSAGDEGNSGVAIDSAGNIALPSESTQAGFPLVSPFKSTPTAKDATFSILSPDLSQLLFSTYYGGSADDRARGVAVINGNHFAFSGDTYSTNYPTTSGASQTTNRGARDFFTTVVVPNGTPPPPVCSFTAVPSSVSFTASGGSQTVTVTASDPSCAWTATGANWVTVTPSSGTGSGTVTVSAPAYTNPTDRTQAVVVAGQTVTVTQTGQTCTFTVTPTAVPLPLTGGTGTLTVTASDATCTWTVTVPSWIVPSRTSGTGSGTVTFTAPDLSRSGQAVVAGKTIAVSQP